MHLLRFLKRSWKLTLFCLFLLVASISYATIPKELEALAPDLILVNGNIVGAEKSANQWPLGDFNKAGIRVTQSSATPVVVPNWKQGIENCLLRESRVSGKVFGPHHRIPAIRQYIINGA